MIANLVVGGLAAGCLYAMVGIAIVIVLNIADIANFAQGEMAMLTTFFAYWLMDGVGLPWWQAVSIAIVFGLVQGIVIQQVVIRPLIGGPVLSAIIATLGLNVVLNSVAGMIWGHQTYTFPSPFAFSAPFMLGGVPIAVDSVVNIVVGLVIIVCMTLFLRFTWIGLGLRAASQNQTVARPTGVSITRTSATAWGLGGVVGAIAGVLVAPSLFLDTNLTGALLIKAFAGGVLGGLNSLIGVFSAASRSASQKTSRAPMCRRRLPMRPPSSSSSPCSRSGPKAFSAASRCARRERRGRNPPRSRPSPAWGAARSRVPAAGLRPLGVNGYVLYLLTLTEIFTLVALGLNFLTGFAGQISLCHAAFFGVGAYATAILTQKAGVPYLVSLFAGALLTTAIGAVVAIPALRLKNIYLAIATLGFGVVLQKIIFEWRGLTGGGGGMALTAPRIAGYELGAIGLYYLTLVLMTLGPFGAWNVSRGRTGRALLVIKDSELPCRFARHPRARYKVIAFAISAFYAAIKGSRTWRRHTQSGKF